MAQYDVYANPAGQGYLLDVQTDFLSGLNTRIVVPLLPEGSAPKPAKRLNPVFVVDGQPHVMVTQFLSAVPSSLLSGRPTSLLPEAVTITTALDMLTHGF